MKKLQQLKEVLNNYNYTTSWQLICLREPQSIKHHYFRHDSCEFLIVDRNEERINFLEWFAFV